MNGKETESLEKALNDLKNTLLEHEVACLEKYQTLILDIAVLKSKHTMVQWFLGILMGLMASSLVAIVIFGTALMDK